MKILQVTAVDFTLKKFLMPLIDATIDDGFDVEIACHVGEFGKELQRQGYVIHHVPFKRSMNVISHVKALRWLICLVRQRKYDCIHAHTPIASLIARMAGRICRVPTIIYTAHGFYFHENMSPIAYKIAYAIEKLWARLFTDYLFFQSAEDYELAKAGQFKKDSQLFHIGNGVPPEKFNPALYDRNKVRSILGFEQDDTVITFMGRLVLEKGIVELLTAYRNIKATYPKVKLLIIGGSVEGDRKPLDVTGELNKMSTSVRKDVFLLGLRDDIPALLAASDVFVLPSYREGLPRSIIEAMAMGKPVIATDIRGCREEVCNGINGYLCKAKDAVDLRNVLLKLLENKIDILKFGMKSRELFLTQFDETVVIRKQLDVFHGIAGVRHHAHVP